MVEPEVDEAKERGIELNESEHHSEVHISRHLCNDEAYLNTGCAINACTVFGQTLFNTQETLYTTAYKVVK